MFMEPFKRSLTFIAYVYLFKEPFKRSLTIIAAFAHMFKEPFKLFLTIITYVYMCKEPSKRSLTIIAYAYMFTDRTYHLTMVKVDIRRFDTNR